MRQILSEAKAMHDRGIVHRSIVPKNVLVVGGGIVIKIGGFGQATCMSERGVPFRSSLSYLAPEVLLVGRGAFESEHVDSWSIGCLMAQLLTGRVLFQGTDWWHLKVGQLRRIFDVSGVPDEETLEDMEPRARRRAKLVRNWWVSRRRRDSWLRDFVPLHVLSHDGFQVLLLACNPKKSLTAAAALQLPWLANHHHDSIAAGAVSQQIVISAPILSRQWWLLTIALALLFLVVYVCVGGTRY
jgi:cell division cycle 2-like